VVVGRDFEWTVIVDTIDGTRGLMYDKRAAWCRRRRRTAAVA
jgi:hypothetical protein